MTHPHQLHARAALWSLRAALSQLATAEGAAASAAAAAADLGTLQAWRPGSGVHAGGGTDVLLDAVIRHASPGVRNPYAERARRTRDTVRWAARRVLGDRLVPGVNVLAQLLDAVPAMHPGTAAYLTRWIDEQDQAARTVLGEPSDHELIPTIGCPHCDSAGQLALRTSAPPRYRVIVCGAGCTCDGPGCGCGMAVEVTGVPHVWSIRQIDTALGS